MRASAATSTAASIIIFLIVSQGPRRSSRNCSQITCWRVLRLTCGTVLIAVPPLVLSARCRVDDRPDEMPFAVIEARRPVAVAHGGAVEAAVAVGEARLVAARHAAVREAAIARRSVVLSPKDKMFCENAG